MLRLRLTTEQRTAVQELRRDESLQLAERDRVEMVLLSDAGWQVSRIAEHLGYCAATVRRVFGRFAQSGPTGLRHQKRGPAPDVSRREQVETALRELLEQARTWTAPQLAAALQERGIALSTHQTRRYLTGPGLRARWRRTQRTLRHKQDPEQVAVARAELEQRKNVLRPAS